MSAMSMMSVASGVKMKAEEWDARTAHEVRVKKAEQWAAVRWKKGQIGGSRAEIEGKEHSSDGR